MDKKKMTSGKNGMNFQSHYVECDQPYKVYSYVGTDWELRVAQQKGTMIIMREDEDGEINYEYKPVFKYEDMDFYLTSERAVVADKDDWFSEEAYLGNVGDTVGLEALEKVMYQEAEYSYTCMMPQDAIRYMELNGLKVDIKKDLPEDGVLRNLTATATRKLHEDKNNGEEVLVLHIGDSRYGQSEFGVLLNDRNYHPVIQMARQINAWRELGVKDFEIVPHPLMEKKHAEAIKELASLAKQHALHKLKYPESIDFMVVGVAQRLKGEDCTMAEFVKAYNDHPDYDFDFDEEYVKEYVVKAEEEGLLKFDGKIIKFSPEFSKIGKWNYNG